MNDDEIMDMLNGIDEVKAFSDSLFVRGPSKSLLNKDLMDSCYTSKKDYTDYSADMYSNDDKDNKMPSGSIARIASKLNMLSKEAFALIDAEAEDRNMSILDVILEKARDRVIQPDVLDELEQKAIEDKFSKIPELGGVKKKPNIRDGKPETYSINDGVAYKDWHGKTDTRWK